MLVCGSVSPFVQRHGRCFLVISAAESLGSEQLSGKVPECSMGFWGWRLGMPWHFGWELLERQVMNREGGVLKTVASVSLCLPFKCKQKEGST